MGKIMNGWELIDKLTALIAYVFAVALGTMFKKK